MRALTLAIFLFGVLMVGVGVVRLLTPGSVEWLPQFTFGFALLVIATMIVRRSFGGVRPKLEDLRRTTADRVILALLGLACLPYAGTLAMVEGPDRTGRIVGGVPGSVILAVVILGFTLIVFSGAVKARR